MSSYLNLMLRLVIWFLLTANLSLANIVIGVCVALLLPRRRTAPGALKDWLRVLWEIIVAVPQAYREAFELVLRPHTEEVVIIERVKPSRISSKGALPSPGLIFLDIFLITFTPKTIVLKYHEEGWYEVHRVQQRQGKGKR
ncbi:Na+/H+ antiporter subunit E [Phormidium sp. FACHB-592]|uniref:Na+/H+ antiporter subunit E n=1 Tax=Stenomitos frigidus AS-A4 TaxID=2933935 RepID=A0ABV0KQD3_9CYAN|nr:Na+/H+ antiporter subunit E [Phormidium sp. FACHB-592]MBD2074991.1 Na+/H+ antiporter subunit E [Phormidium sp. FACHB-592]